MKLSVFISRFGYVYSVIRITKFAAEGRYLKFRSRMISLYCTEDYSDDMYTHISIQHPDDAAYQLTVIGN